MKGEHFVVFAYGGEFSHLVSTPEVVIIKGEDYLSVYTSHHSYINSKPIKYGKIQSEMAEIIDKGGIIVLKNADNYALSPAWAELGKSNPTDMVNHIEDHVFDIDAELKLITKEQLNLNDGIGPQFHQSDLCYALHTEVYAPIWQKGSEVTIIENCVNDADIILNLVQTCSNAGYIKVRSRATGVIKGFDLEW
tara:strand:- start:2159 stop:2737 length:579 start_codon:yes stop_codon:yes gene_type:complete